MKPKLIELDIDTIGDQEKPLTIEEQRSISAFIKKRKEALNKSLTRKSISTIKKKNLKNEKL
jgi:hypothetical protein